MTARARTKQARAARQMMEMMTVAPVVVAQRVSRAAGTKDSNSTKQREAHRMVSEKVQASGESMMGMAFAAMRINAAFAGMMMRPWMLPGSRRPGAAALSTFLQSAAADLTSSALAPPLRKAKANARRLSR